MRHDWWRRVLISVCARVGLTLRRNDPPARRRASPGVTSRRLIPAAAISWSLIAAATVVAREHSRRTGYFVRARILSRTRLRGLLRLAAAAPVGRAVLGLSDSVGRRGLHADATILVAALATGDTVFVATRAALLRYERFLRG